MKKLILGIVLIAIVMFVIGVSIGSMFTNGLSPMCNCEEAYDDGFVRGYGNGQKHAFIGFNCFAEYVDEHCPRCDLDYIGIEEIGMKKEMDKFLTEHPYIMEIFKRYEERHPPPEGQQSTCEERSI